MGAPTLHWGLLSSELKKEEVKENVKSVQLDATENQTNCSAINVNKTICRREILNRDFR